MRIKEIRDYSQIRARARAYLCYIISRNISNRLQSADSRSLLGTMDQLSRGIPKADAIYVLDGNGIQITPNKSKHKTINGKGENEDRSDRSYYYYTVSEHRCTLTDPYPSMVNSTMIVTASFPIYDENDILIYIICVDISLSSINKMMHPSSANSNFSSLTKITYTIFFVALGAISVLLFIKGIATFISAGVDFSNIDINEIFNSTILLTLSLAIFDLVKAIFEEEVLGKEKSNAMAGESHLTMVKFLGSIIIALSIEALMLVFKFALTDPGQLKYAVYLIAAISMLLISLSIYIKFNHRDSKKKH